MLAMKKLILACTIAIAVPAAGIDVRAQSGYDLLQKALATERADGNLRGAIQLYERIVKEFGSDRALSARALVRIGECYERLGQREAVTAYERLVREFPDQIESAAIARERLASLQAAAAPRTSAPSARLVWSGQDAFGSVRGSISPDGELLTFLQSATGALAVRDLRAGTTRVLTNEPGSMFYAVFSPDGRQVAYAWTVRNGATVTADLRVLPVTGRDGTPPRVVHRNEEITQLRPFGWTPDGAQVLVLRSLKDGTNQIALVSVRDGSARVIKSLPWNYTAMSLSPDGRHIAYDAVTADRGAPSEIFVLATDGSRETNVVRGESVNNSPLWAPDGSRLLFLSNRTGTTSLWAIPMADGRPTGAADLVKANLGQVRLQGVTRKGAVHYLIGGIGRTNIYTAQLDAASRAVNAPVPVTERFLNSNSAPAWSPDGQHLAYLSSRGQGGTVLVIRATDTGAERDIPMPSEVQTGNLVPAPRWFPDGSALLVWGLRLREGLFYRIDVQSGAADLLHTAKGAAGGGGLGASAISPDGTAIVYTALVDTSSTLTKLVRFDLASRQETVVKTGMFGAVALSPDGTQLALNSYDGGSGGCFLEVIPATGGPGREVVRTGDCNPNRLTWSPDNQLLFVRGGNNQPNTLWRVSPAGGSAEQIGISMPGQLMYPHVHPDGRQLAFGVFETGASEVWALENVLPMASTRR